MDRLLRYAMTFNITGENCRLREKEGLALGINQGRCGGDRRDLHGDRPILDPAQGVIHRIPEVDRQSSAQALSDNVMATLSA